MHDILLSKAAFRSRLASLPIVEKLEMLDQLRERSLDIAASRAQRMHDEELLKRSSTAAPHSRFEIEQTDEAIREFRRKKPYQENLAALIHEPSFRDILPMSLFQNVRLIHQPTASNGLSDNGP